jgi:hypothetical protein
MRDLRQARALIYQMVNGMRAAGRQGKIESIEFVLCEDFRTVMIFADVDDEPDALAIWFDLKPGEAFNHNQYRKEFLDGRR